MSMLRLRPGNSTHQFRNSTQLAHSRNSAGVAHTSLNSQFSAASGPQRALTASHEVRWWGSEMRWWGSVAQAEQQVVDQAPLAA